MPNTTQPNVEAVILAGGKGTRLAPITEDIPKPMLKVLGRTVLENVFDKVSECGITNAAVTTMYLPWQIESLGNKKGSLNIEYIREKTPLGTAGAVRNAYSGKGDFVLVLSGDGLFNFDLKKALDFHLERNADVTIVTYSTDNPLEYGVVLYDGNGKVRKFAEKPPWAQVVSGTVNTGIYIINREIIEQIPKNTEYDFAKQLFPLLLARKKAVYAYEAQGVWHDIGNLDGYFTANCSALDGKIQGMDKGGLTEKELKERQIDAEMPVYVSKDAVIGTGVKLGAYTVISAGAVISDNCDIACSVIGDGVTLGMGCGIYGTIVGRNAVFGENCVTSEGCAIGAEAELRDSVILPKFTLVHSGECVSGNAFRSASYGRKENTLIKDDGIDLDVSLVSPEYVMRVGYSTAVTVCAAKTPGSTRIGVMSDDNSQSRRMAGIILEGVRSAGVRSVEFGTGFEAMARFAALEFITDIIIYVGRDKSGHISAKLFDASGLPVSGKFERELASAFYGYSEYTAPDRFYEPDVMSDMWTLYYNCLIKECRTLLSGKELSDFSCTFSGTGDIRAYSPEYTAICAVSELGGSVVSRADSAMYSFSIDNTGLNSSCSSRKFSLDSHHMNTILIDGLDDSMSLSNMFLSDSMPEAYRIVAEKRGYTVNRYAQSSPRELSIMNRDPFRKTFFLYDGVFRTLFFAILMHRSGSDAATIVKRLPDFEVYSEFFDGGNPNRAYVMQYLSKLAGNKDKDDGTEGHDGIRLELAGGRVTVIPGRVSGFRIISEASSMEAAKELCAAAEEYLK